MAEQGFTLTCADFVPYGDIPHQFTCDGDNVSPELKWLHSPPGTRSFVLLVDDPDTPSGTFTHWILFNIPADITELPRGSSADGVSGRNDFHHAGYRGPCPPPNHGKHRYHFHLYALDTDTLELDEGATRAAVEDAMKDHILDQTFVVGLYERTTG